MGWRWLALWGGSQLAVDTTLVSPLTSASAPRRAGGRTAGAALSHACKAKERTYPELRQSARCKLVVLAFELGGRWSAEAATFVRLLARLSARALPASSRGAGISAYASRWSALLSFAAARAFAASLSPARPMLMARPRCSATSSLTPPLPRPLGVHWDRFAWDVGKRRGEKQKRKYGTHSPRQLSGTTVPRALPAACSPRAQGHLSAPLRGFAAKPVRVSLATSASPT